MRSVNQNVGDTADILGTCCLGLEVRADVEQERERVAGRRVQMDGSEVERKKQFQSTEQDI